MVGGVTVNCLATCTVCKETLQMFNLTHAPQEEPERDVSDFVSPLGVYWNRIGNRMSRNPSVPARSLQDRASRMASGLEEDLLGIDH